MTEEWPFTPTVCPGYTTSLPEVHEAAMARKWAERGMLKDREDGDVSTLMFAAIDLLDVGISEVEQAEMNRARSQ